MKKSDKTYFADVQADILKYVGRMGQHDSFGRFEANIDGFDYIMYVVANGAVGWFIPYQYDALSGIEQFEPPSAPFLGFGVAGQGRKKLDELAALAALLHHLLHGLETC